MNATVPALLFCLAACGTSMAPPSPTARPDAAVDPVAPPDSGQPAPPTRDAGTEQPQVLPWNLGARLDPDAGAVEFRVFSAHATRISLELYREALRGPSVRTVVLDADGKGTFAARVPLDALGDAGLSAPLFYGYRAWGPNWPYDAAFTPGSLSGFVSEGDAQGNHFNPNKLLMDPYALEMSHDPANPASLSGAPYQNDAAHRAIDSAPLAPKGVVLALPRPQLGTRPARALKDDVIYEVHVRGLTRNDTSLPEALRGTYAGAAQRAQALAALGVTAIELLPVQETQNDTNDVSPNEVDSDNYWGYSTLAYFAPDRRYAADRSVGGPTREFQAMARAFHDAGLKVFIDVVYNHTAEYGLLSFRGLDNPTYYSLTADRQGSWNTNGVSGNFNTRNAVAQALIVDSLKYWHEVLGVDGFRFDLAPVLGNTCEHGCFHYARDDQHTALGRITAELDASVDLIAEPWAVGDGSYQLGNFPSRWAEWNGQFRDTVRSKQNKVGVEPTTLQQLVTRLTGSGDLFGDDGRAPGASVNFVVSHDGFTMRDVYACNAKNNGQSWPYGPSNGGENDNKSWDQGGDPADQRRAARTGLALLALSAGAVMVTGGDEQLRSMRCNNNAYNVDSAANGLSYPLSGEEQAHRAFVQRLFVFRNAHPALRPAQYWRADDGNGNGLEQLRWYQPSGAVADGAYLNNGANHALGWRLDGSELGESGALFVAYNGWLAPLLFTLPSAGPGKQWYLASETCTASEGPEQLLGGQGFALPVCARGLALLVAR